MKRMRCAVMTAAMLATLAAPALAFDFALIGDTPYNPEDSLALLRMIPRINSADVAFVLHAGDIKSGSQSCSDEVLETRLRMFEKFTHPMILVPGDNDWTDCHRQGAGAWAPLERLARLRALFFLPPGKVLGTGRMKVESQGADAAYAEFPENVRWQRDGVHFATLHIVGSSNGLRSFATRTTADDDEVARRTAASLDWMRLAFERATADKAPGLLLAIHANPGFEAYHDSTFRAAFASFREALVPLVMAYDRPVMLIHGDSHYFRIDKPLKGPSGRRLDLFTRVETFGVPHNHWLRVRVDPADPMVFRVRQEIVPENIQRR